MLRYLDSQKFGRSQLDWLDSHFHFSFAEYFNPANINFGILRVINDDLIKPQTGFDTHPHQDMEIISYVVNGELSHADSMNNQKTVKRGQVQYMSAGTGVLHSEHNRGEDLLRILQIWIYPNQKGYAPNYGDYAFNWEDRKNRWLPLVSGDGDKHFPIQIHADIHIYATEIETGKQLSFEVLANRQAYLVLIEGNATINNIALKMRDALEVTAETLEITADQTAHLLVLEMAKS